MARREFITPEGLRCDGRRPRELRKLAAKLGVFPESDGSCYLEQGQTRVLAVVSGPRGTTSKSQTQHDQVDVRCEFTLASFSTTQRRNRIRADNQTTEKSQCIANTVKAAIITSLYPRSRIDIFVQVLQADGGVLAAAINAAGMALMDAGVPMRDFISACSASVIDGTHILDINGLEKGARGPELTIALLPKSKTLVLNQLESRVHLDSYEELQNLAIDGCEAVKGVLQGILVERTKSLLTSFGPQN